MAEVARDQIPSDLPPIPSPTPRRLNTGNVALDEASERMPFEQRRVMQQLRDQGQVNVAPLSGAQAQYSSDPRVGIVVDPAVLEHWDEGELAKSLTHEATHALQPERVLGPVGQQLTRDPVVPTTTGIPYLDDPREVEARNEEARVASAMDMRERLRERRRKPLPPPEPVQKLLKDQPEGQFILSDESTWVKTADGRIRRIR